MFVCAVIRDNYSIVKSPGRGPRIAYIFLVFRVFCLGFEDAEEDEEELLRRLLVRGRFRRVLIADFFASTYPPRCMVLLFLRYVCRRLRVTRRRREPPFVPLFRSAFLFSATWILLASSKASVFSFSGLELAVGPIYLGMVAPGLPESWVGVGNFLAEGSKAG